ncbi:hypothetical protein NIES4073_38120 [Kalymmatonema gypsitolerans NIES-4073]|nr:hypothetical protein NIES4073_38120 [Scytonema sp. NIES-4073]
MLLKPMQFHFPTVNSRKTAVLRQPQMSQLIRELSDSPEPTLRKGGKGVLCKYFPQAEQRW